MANEMSTTGASTEHEVEPGKLFVGGLSWKTNKESLHKHFSQFGELEDCTVMVDKEGQPRGFGFVKFKNPEHAGAVLCAGDHNLDGKKVDPKAATKNGQNGPTKVFVGGLPQNTQPEDVSLAFSSFGSIAPNGIDIKIDNSTSKQRGFGFVTFVSKESADKAIRQKWVQVNEKQVEVKVAENLTPKGRGGYPRGPGGYGNFGGQAYHQDGRQMAQQQSTYPGYGAAPHYSGHQYQYPNYPPSGYGGNSTGYPMYSQSTTAHAQTMNSYDGGYSGYGSSRDPSYPQQYGYTQQQQQQQPYGGSQAGHTGYSRSQQGYNGYPVHQ